MNNKIKITIYMPCRNYGRYLSKSLESIKNQLFNEWELFIIDEASDDKTKIIADNFLIENKNQYKIQYIYNNKPNGLQKIANNILNICSGKYIIRLDPDDWLDESALLVLFNKIESLEGCDLVYSDYYFVNDNGQVIANDRQLKFSEDDKVGIIPPNGACCLIRTRALKAIGGYSEKFNAQDGHEIWFKLTSRMKSAHITLPLFYYRQHPNSLSKNENKLFEARKEIYNTLSRIKSGDYKLKVLGVIPIKENFPNIKNVPYLKLNDESLLEISIKQAAKSNFISDLVISSCSDDTLKYANQIAKKIKFEKLLLNKRDKKEIINSAGVPTLELMIKAGELYNKHNGTFPDIVIFLNLHAYKRKSEEIDQSISLLKLTSSDSVVSVVKERKPIFKYGNFGLDLLNEGRLSDINLQREVFFSYEGSIITTWWDILVENKIFGEKITPLELDSSRTDTSLKNLKD